MKFRRIESRKVSKEYEKRVQITKMAMAVIVEHSEKG
jgi:hypothetical protein